MQCHDTAPSLSHSICPSVEGHISLNQTLYIGKQTVREQPVKTRILVPCVSSHNHLSLSSKCSGFIGKARGRNVN